MAGVVLTRDATTLDLRLRCHLVAKWDRLLRAAPKRGSNRIIAGERGQLERVRVGDQVRTAMQIEIDGWYDTDGTRFTGDSDVNVHTLLDLVLDFLDDDDPCTITINRPGALAAVTGVMQVEDPGEPRWLSEELARLTVDVTFPNGRLTVGGS